MGLIMFNYEREIWIQVDGESMKSLIGRGAGGKAGWIYRWNVDFQHRALNHKPELTVSVASMTSKYNKKRQ